MPTINELNSTIKRLEAQRAVHQEKISEITSLIRTHMHDVWKQRYNLEIGGFVQNGQGVFQVTRIRDMWDKRPEVGGIKWLEAEGVFEPFSITVNGWRITVDPRPAPPPA